MSEEEIIRVYLDSLSEAARCMVARGQSRQSFLEMVTKDAMDLFNEHIKTRSDPVKITHSDVKIKPNYRIKPGCSPEQARAAAKRIVDRMMNE